MVATNFDLSLPQDLLDKGTVTFRRHKGCKRNCTLLTDDDEEEGEGDVMLDVPLGEEEPTERRRDGGGRRRHPRSSSGHRAGNGRNRMRR